VILTIELAGVREDDLEIELYPDAVIVSGNRPMASGGPDEVYHALQIRRGPFHLDVPLPAVIDVDRVDASLENGMLAIKLAKLPRSAGDGVRPGRTPAGRGTARR
jgi:HSP20 family molecular chaperone IbpA